MTKKNNIILIGVIIFATIAISGSIAFLGYQISTNNVSDKLQQNIAQGINTYIAKQRSQQQAKSKQVQEAKIKKLIPYKEGDHLQGPKNAKFSLIEYSDFECPFCKKFHLTAKQLLENNKNVNWIYRHFPLSFHEPLSSKESIASECVAALAGNKAFWQYADALFAKTNSNGNGLKIADLTLLAKQIGIDATKFQTCTASNKYNQHIKQEIIEGKNAGVTGTPGNFIRNNKTGVVKFVAGAYPLSFLQNTIKQLQ